MRKFRSLMWFLHLIIFLLFIVENIVLATSGRNRVAPDYTELKKLFLNPPREYANAPLWVWNEMLTKEQVISTLRDLANQDVKQVFVHPRPGLMTPYLSDEWFKLWGIALEEAKRLDMNVWIYDENSYPSGFAGGWVPELMPESRGRGLLFKESATPPEWATNIIAIFKIDKDSFTDITGDVIRRKEFPKGSYLTGYLQMAANSPWHGNRYYVDLLYPGVTEKFLELTLEAYKKHFGSEFGKRIPGSFTDEPQITPAGGIPWTKDLNYQFKKRWGYSLVENLPSLYKEIGDWQQVRHNYYATLLELFIERWAKPYYDYCSSNKLEFTGHYWEHEWPNCVMVPDNMAMAAWQHRPGIDILMNRYEEHTHAQFGNIRACREISSIANQLGRGRTLVEIYGAGGWDLRFEDMKRIGDWLFALGVNTLDEHLSYISIRGARKRDHPQSFSYHEPWWDSYHVVANYFKKLSAVLSQGEQINRILVIEPTTTAWMYQGNHQILGELGRSFFNFLKDLEANQIEYDLGCEDVIARYGEIKDKEFKIGNRQYHTVVIPPIASPDPRTKSPEFNLNRKTFILMETFAANGGRIISCGTIPERIDGKKSPRIPVSPLVSNILKMSRETAISTLKKLQEEEGTFIVRAQNDRGILFHNRRTLAHGELIFLVNSSLEYKSTGVVMTKKGVRFQVWDPISGINEWENDFVNRIEDKTNYLKYHFNLPPGGSLLLYMATKIDTKKTITDAYGLYGHKKAQVREEIPCAGNTEIRRLKPNVLTIDYVDITAGGETIKDIYFYKANQFAFKKNGLDRNPWDSAVQFKDELIKYKFPDKSGFTVSYKFIIEGKVPQDLEIVIENPKIYKRITCNGHEIKIDGKKWWLDKSFGRIPISEFARAGLNTVTLEAAPMTIFHEIEPAYVLGSFNLRAIERGFAIVEDKPLLIDVTPDTTSGNDTKSVSSQLQLTHINNPDGTMWLSAGMGFENNPASNDKTPFVIFDLGKEYYLSEIKIWNYNENHVRDLTTRGVKRMRILADASILSGAMFDLGIFNLEKADGIKALPQTIKVGRENIRYVKFEIIENHAGVIYPPVKEPPDNGFVGLAEVMFFDKNGTPIRGVNIHDFSSELLSHRRLAKYLVDKSGLEQSRKGWNMQGHPFYAHGVAYRQQFLVTNFSSKYEVHLTDWYGSVAKVFVNKQLAGIIWHQPWKCDVTRFIKRGKNEIEVVVVGTLKNTLGPHHGNPGLGSAWPSMFHNAPEQGPPPGINYSTVSYGMFEPFKLFIIRE